MRNLDFNIGISISNLSFCSSEPRSSTGSIVRCVFTKKSITLRSDSVYISQARQPTCTLHGNATVSSAQASKASYRRKNVLTEVEKRKIDAKPDPRQNAIGNIVQRVCLFVFLDIATLRCRLFFAGSSANVFSPRKTQPLLRRRPRLFQPLKNVSEV